MPRQSLSSSHSVPKDRYSLILTLETHLLGLETWRDSPFVLNAKSTSFAGESFLRHFLDLLDGTSTCK